MENTIAGRGLEKNPALPGLTFLGVAMIVIGWHSLTLRFASGLTPTNLTSNWPYGLYVVIYIFWIGCSAGGVSVSSLLDFFGIEKKYQVVNKIALWVSWVALTAGLLFVTLDLGHVERFFYIYLSFQPSSILWWESIFYLVYFVILTAKIILVYKDKAKSVARGLSIAGIPVALFGVHAGTGAIFASISTISYWHGPMLPIIFIVSALVSGSALVNWLSAFLAPREEREFTKTLAKYFILPMLCFDASLIFFEFVIPLYGGHPEHTLVYKEVLLGPKCYVFWAHIVFGIILPFIILTAGRLRNSVPWVSLASFLLFTMTFCVRWNIIVPPMKSHSEFSHIGEVTYYAPTAMEWLSSLGILGILVIIFAIGGFILFQKRTGTTINEEVKHE